MRLGGSSITSSGFTSPLYKLDVRHGIAATVHGPAEAADPAWDLDNPARSWLPLARRSSVRQWPKCQRSAHCGGGGVGDHALTTSPQ